MVRSNLAGRGVTRRIPRAIGERRGGPILMFLRSTDGGIAQYMHAQALELSRRGIAVVLLAPKRFLAEHAVPDYDVRPVVFEVPDVLRQPILRRICFALLAIVNPLILAGFVMKLRPRLVLLDAMTELLAPLWAWPHILLATRGVIYAATLHDPFRDRVGPTWWHSLSMRLAYRPLRIGLVHDLPAARAAGVPQHIKLVEVPHGIFPIVRSAESIDDVRARIGIERDAPVALAFGYIVDRKNLDLAIEALARVPALHLVIAGRTGSLRDRPASVYRAAADRAGVGDRCHILDRYIDDREISGLFAAADFLMMTYSRRFVSQSGVLHVAANWNLPVLACGGPGPLIETVSRFDLGHVIEPDSIEALIDGLLGMIARVRPNRVNADAAWQVFRTYASWERNIDGLLAAVGQVEEER